MIQMLVMKKCDESIPSLVDILKLGGVAILPTDTIYGFSAVAGGEFDGAKKIRKLKGRAESKQFIRLISGPKDIYNITSDNIPKKLLDLWPGPLTLIVNKKVPKNEYQTSQNCDKNVQDTVAVRCPNDTWLRSVIRRLGRPIYSTSVNNSNDPPLTNISKIIKEFGELVDVVIDSGDCENTLPSTIVKVTDDNFKIIRQGVLTVPLNFI